MRARAIISACALETRHDRPRASSDKSEHLRRGAADADHECALFTCSLACCRLIGVARRMTTPVLTSSAGIVRRQVPCAALGIGVIAAAVRAIWAATGAAQKR